MRDCGVAQDKQGFSLTLNKLLALFPDYEVFEVFDRDFRVNKDEVGVRKYGLGKMQKL